MKSPARLYSVFVGIAYVFAIGSVVWITTEWPFVPAAYLTIFVAPISYLAIFERGLTMWLRQSSWATLRPALWLAAGLAILVWFELPIRAKFFLSRPALEQAAREAPFNQPRRAGLFVLENATVRDELIFLGASQPRNSFIGLVRRSKGSALHMGNAWYAVGFDSEWQFFSED